jgi:hypothetical protein
MGNYPTHDSATAATPSLFLTEADCEQPKPIKWYRDEETGLGCTDPDRPEWMTLQDFVNTLGQPKER